MDETPMLDAALSYARQGLAVFPLMERDKVPAVEGGVKSATTVETVIMNGWGSRPGMNVGIACGSASGGLVVIDLDVHPEEGEDGTETLRVWEREHGSLPATATSLTGSGGVHLLYRTNSVVRNSVNKELGVDIRSDGGYIVAPPSVHPNGTRYEFEDYLQDVPIAQADENVMAFIAHVQKGVHVDGERFVMPESVGKGERNDKLFRLACSYQSQGFNDETILYAVLAANKRICKPALTDDEVERIVQSALTYEKGQDAEERSRNDADAASQPSTKTFNGFARLLIKNDHACFVDGAPAVWDGAKYATGWDAIDRAILLHEDGCKATKRKEIREYINAMAPRVEASPPSLIAFANGVWDMGEGLKPYSPEMVITNVIPHELDLNTYDEATDIFLTRISDGNPTVRQNLEEVIGLCMYRSNDFDTCPVLIGGGSNGKSTYIAALRNVLGSQNVSSLDLNIVGKQFQAGRLLGKLANLGDDISNEFLKGDTISIFKKIVSGEWIYTDVKGSSGFEFKPYCTLVFSCNEFPALGDSSEGTMRRLFPIPFNAQFSRSDGFYDPYIGEKVCTPQAARYLVNLGILGLERIIKNNGMTPNAERDALVNDVRVENNNVLQWMEDEGIEVDYLIGRPIPNCYQMYTTWCGHNNVRNVAKRTTFSRRIISHFGLKSEARRHDVNGTKKQIKTFVRRYD